MNTRRKLENELLDVLSVENQEKLTTLLRLVAEDNYAAGYDDAVDELKVEDETDVEEKYNPLNRDTLED